MKISLDGLTAELSRQKKQKTCEHRSPEIISLEEQKERVKKMNETCDPLKHADSVHTVALQKKRKAETTGRTQPDHLRWIRNTDLTSRALGELQAGKLGEELRLDKWKSERRTRRLELENSALCVQSIVRISSSIAPSQNSAREAGGGQFLVMNIQCPQVANHSVRTYLPATSCPA